jgi:hypothetical protein
MVPALQWLRLLRPALPGPDPAQVVRAVSITQSMNRNSRRTSSGSIPSPYNPLTGRTFHAGRSAGDRRVSSAFKWASTTTANGFGSA